MKGDMVEVGEEVGVEELSVREKRRWGDGD
jgi:hypothetical protein